MKKLNNILAGALFLIGSAAFAQQETTITMYRYHMNMVNPAYAGMDGETVLTSTFRDQWTGVPESPLTQAVSFGTTVGKNLGLGVSMVNDKNFVEKQTFVGIDFSYKVKMTENSDLYLGVKAGGNFYNVNSSGLNTYNIQADPALGDISTFTPNAGLGAVLKSDKYFVSFSVPRMLSTEKAKNEAGYAVMATDKAHFYLSGGYDFDLSNTLVLKPSVMMRYVDNAPMSTDFTALMQFNKVFEIGGTYRTDQAYAVMGDVTINKRLLVGYAYERSTRPEMASAKSTNEILLRFKF